MLFVRSLSIVTLKSSEALRSYARIYKLISHCFRVISRCQRFVLNFSSDQSMPFKDGKQGLAGPFQLSSRLSKSVQEQN